MKQTDALLLKLLSKVVGVDLTPCKHVVSGFEINSYEDTPIKLYIISTNEVEFDLGDFSSVKSDNEAVLQEVWRVVNEYYEHLECVKESKAIEKLKKILGEEK